MSLRNRCWREQRRYKIRLGEHWAAYLNKHENKIVVIPQNGTLWAEDFGLSEWIRIQMTLLEK